MTDLVLTVARAICRSRTCEGISCCQWPAQGGRTECPVDKGGYTDAASAAIDAIDTWRTAEKRKNCKHDRKHGGGGVNHLGDGYHYWSCQDCGTSYDSRANSSGIQKAET